VSRKRFELGISQIQVRRVPLETVYSVERMEFNVDGRKI
jgi:hypothetical protein